MTTMKTDNIIYNDGDSNELEILDEYGDLPYEDDNRRRENTKATINLRQARKFR